MITRAQGYATASRSGVTFVAKALQSIADAQTEGLDLHRRA
jgi:hypothetical protein